MIIVTGAAGFIGSCLVNKLNNNGYTDILVVDDFSRPDKNRNLSGKVFRQRLDREVFPAWLEQNHQKVSYVFHLGARTDTTEFRKSVFDHLNLNFSKKIWSICTRFEIPFVYASSAATYGAGEHGYSDSHELVAKLKPLNPYGQSKQDFDVWVLQQESCPHFWAGLKFFNVFGPNEYHKGRMASVILHAFNQISKTGEMSLFRSHKAGFADGGQLRDFIYVRDVIRVCLYMMHHKLPSGLYNLGTGLARSFNDLATACFQSMNREPVIKYIDTPEDIRDKYQYYTQASVQKLREAGYLHDFYTLEEGIHEYITEYLLSSAYY